MRAKPPATVTAAADALATTTVTTVALATASVALAAAAEPEPSAAVAFAAAAKPEPSAAEPEPSAAVAVAAAAVAVAPTAVAVAAVALAAAALEPTSIHGGTGEVVSSIELGRYDDGTARYRPLPEVWSDRNSWQPRHNNVDCNGELQTTLHAALHAPHTPLQFTRAARAPPRERSPHPDRRYAPARPPMHYTHDPEPASRVQWWSDTGMVQRGSGQYRQRSQRSSRTRGRVRTRD